MELVSLKKFDRHVCLADRCRTSFLLLLGILWNFLEGAGSNYPKILSDEGPGSMVQLHFGVLTIPACVSTSPNLN